MPSPRTLLALAALAAAPAFAPAQSTRPAVEPGDAYRVAGITQPDEDLQLAFPMRGRVGRVLVEKGEAVEAGQTLVVLEDTQQQVAVKKAQLEAQRRAPAIVELRGKELEKAKVDLDRIVTANVDRAGTYNTTEVREAELAVEQAQAQLKVAAIEVEAAESEVEAQQATLDLMKVTSPVAGIVRDVAVGVGEVVDEQRPAAVVVASDPVKIAVVDLNSAQVSGLRVGQQFPVRYAGREGVDDDWRKATISWIDPVVDAGSKIHLIELTMPNPEGIEAGRDVELALPSALADREDARRRGFGAASRR